MGKDGFGFGGVYHMREASRLCFRKGCLCFKNAVILKFVGNIRIVIQKNMVYFWISQKIVVSLYSEINTKEYMADYCCEAK